VPPPPVFINYRSNEAGWAAYLDKTLGERFGPHQVFRASRSIEPSEDFRARILAALDGAALVVPVIGPRWIDVTDEAGRRRLDNDEDWVRREIAHALRRGITVLPVLVDGAAPLTAQALPADIARLADLQYVRLDRRTDARDAQVLGDHILRLLPPDRTPPGGAPDPARTRRPGAPAGRRVGLLAVLGVVLVLAGLLTWRLQYGSDRSAAAARTRTVTPPPAPSGAAHPWFVLEPATGRPAERFRVIGANFPARQQVKAQISVGGRWLVLGLAQTDEVGAFVLDVDPVRTGGVGRLAVGRHQVTVQSTRDAALRSYTDYPVTP
jgi:hypothetical protein